MKNIVLVCNMGMSTSSLVKKIRKHAESIGYECTVEAYPVSEIAKVAPTADCILVGPQISYRMNDIKKAAGAVPVKDIPMKTYGMMDGKAVFEIAQGIMGE